MRKGRMKGDRNGQKQNEASAPLVTQGNARFMRLEEQLLWGIPNEVTLELIATKLPWRAFHNLSSVSRAWQQAIQDRLIYDARVRCHSTETVIVVNHVPYRDTNAIALRSVRDITCYQLPPIPQVDSGIPWSSHCISLDGKIYIVGGVKDSTLQLGSEEVYMFDLAGQRQWKQCARMLEARLNFGCGVKDGKIYVFGGTSLDACVRGSEVYDPNTNTWSAIRPMRCLRFNCEVLTNGEELFVYGGNFYAPRYRNGARYNVERSADGLRAYHPGTDKWRTLYKDSEMSDDQNLFTAGEVHSMGFVEVDV